MTGNTIIELEHYISSLSEVVVKGFSFDLEENLDGLSCIAAPVFNEYGEAVYAISISGPSNRFAKIDLDHISVSLLSIANDITREYGGKKPKLKIN